MKNIMAKDKKVEQITDMEVDFAQWFTDVCKKAQLIDYSSIKGVFIYRPYGYAIWENIQNILDKEFKKQGVENVYMPLLIPESLLQKEKDHVEGFAPECAWVTLGGGERLEEKYAIRPTSETLFCEHFAHVLQSHRDLPMKYNQWCSVLRWEKTSRPFLRHREFLWQEGHTVHATAEEAVQESLIKIAKNIKSVKYPADNSTISFIMTVTKRTAIDKARVELKVTPDSIDDENNYINYADVKAIDIEKAVTEQGLEKIYTAINNLSPAYREAIILKIIHGYSNSEIAKLLKLNPKTVEMRIYRGRAILKSKLMEEEVYDVK